MRYGIPVQIADWTKRFSGRTPETEAPPPKPKRKVTVKKTAVKKSLPVSALKSEPKRETTSLVFIKKEPVTFQIRRLEHPADFERMAFVIRACSSDPQRKALMVLHVEQVKDRRHSRRLEEAPLKGAKNLCSLQTILRYYYHMVLTFPFGMC
jgi:hypothetical protein